MCGIVGFVAREPLLGGKTLEAMRDALAHRGPDDAGCRLWDVHGRPFPSDAPNHDHAAVGLAHRRLSILDLSKAGHQPMANADETSWIVHNGESYNFEEARKELGSRAPFRSRSDTEVLLRLYDEHGIERALKRTNGMFAFAVWDTTTRTLVLARDRLGKKPLYYMQIPGGGLVFASEIKALLQSGLVNRDEIDETALVQFWTYGYATGERTIYRQIKRLLPGHYATWRDGQLRTFESWDCPFAPDANSGADPQAHLDDLADELEALLLDAIGLRLVSDVPVGLFLSSGIDSGLLAALTARATGKSINTFTVGFAEQPYNEAPRATAIARHLGLPSRELTVSEALGDAFSEIAAQFDEPFGDSSAVPTYFLSKAAREHVTVALTGDGGDETFAGYDAYAKALSFWGDPEQRRIFRHLLTPIQKLVGLRTRLQRGDRRLTALEMIMDQGGLREVLSPSVWENLGGENPYASRERWYTRGRNTDLLSQLQYMNIKTYLPDDILVKVDRMSMAHGLECRSPLLDYRVVEFAARLPYHAKIDASGNRKVLLRHLLRRYVPDALVSGPKMGFSVPWAQWCQGPMGDDLRNRWQCQQNSQQRSQAADRLFPRHKTGWTSWQWNAFASLRFFADNSEAAER